MTHHMLLGTKFYKCPVEERGLNSTNGLRSEVLKFNKAKIDRNALISPF